MKKTLRALTILMLVAVMTLLSAVPAFAASGAKTDPYGYTWLDETNDIWYFQYYVYDKSENAYFVEDYAYLKGNKLFDRNDDQIFSSVYAMDSNPNVDGKPTVAFYKDSLYFITQNGEVCKMNSSTASKYTKCTNVSGAKYFVLDADGLGSKVSSKNLSNLSFSGSYKRNSTISTDDTGSVTNKAGNYVLTSAYPGDPTKIVHNAYLDDELLISIYCKNSNVWVETEQLLLSETCVGAKFVGYSHDYFTILYDLDGTVYAFAYDDFDKALPISLGEEIMSYTKDENGFIESITTTRKTYNLDDLLEDYGYDDAYWANDISYVKNYANNKSVAYDEDSDAIGTLKKTNNYMYWNDKKLTDSYASTYFGITDDGYPVWINKDGDLYYFDGEDEIFVDENVTLIRYNGNGFAYQYKVGTKTYKLNF